MSDSILLDTLRQAVAERYDLVAPLGDRTYRAGDLHAFGRPVVIRAMRLDAEDGERMLTRVWRARSLRHPGIAGVLAAWAENGIAYVVTEYVEGVPLDERLRTEGALPVDVARSILEQVARALDHAREHGVVVRAVTPSQIVVDRTGRAVVVDLGLTEPDERPSLTRAGAIVGDPAYTSPEQWRGEAITTASEQYALGVLGYHMLTGRVPFAGAPMEVMRDHLVAAPRAIRESRPDCPPDLDATLTRMLAKDAAERWPTLGDVADAFARVAPPRLDENVQFTVYRPKVVAPDEWRTLLAFAHLAESRPDAPPDEPDPVEEMHRQAARRLGDTDAYHHVTQDAGAAVPQQGQLVFVPDVDGIEFNPPRRSFAWTEPVHCEEFRFRASATLDGTVARGRLTVFLGAIILADVPLRIEVDAARGAHADRAPERSAARRYRRIFASYSHADAPIVEQFGHYAKALGDDFLRDVTELRTGEVWSERIEQMIREADVFQLFWSSNSMRSTFVRQEWECALAQAGRSSYVRPVYWEVPLPELPGENLPPEALRRLHFQQLPGATPVAPPVPARAAPPMPPPMPVPAAPSPSAPSPYAASPSAASPSAASPRPSAPAFHRRRRWGALVGGGAAVAVAAAIGYQGMRASHVGPPVTTVVDTVPTSLAVLPDTLRVTVGQSLALPGRLRTAAGETLSIVHVRWVPRGDSAVSVIGDRIVGQRAGTASITAMVGGQRATLPIVVEPRAPTPHVSDASARRLVQDFADALARNDRASLQRAMSAESRDAVLRWSASRRLRDVRVADVTVDTTAVAFRLDVGSIAALGRRRRSAIRFRGRVDGVGDEARLVDVAPTPAAGFPPR